MERTLTLLISSLAWLALFCGCAAKHPGVKELAVAEAKASLDAKDAVFVDVNAQDFRAKFGLVPGAVRAKSCRRTRRRS
jgi:hypothetical protein